MQKNQTEPDVPTIGERVGVSLDSDQIYPTLLEDITEDNHLIISVPLYRGIPIILRIEQQILLYFFRDNGRFCLDVQVDEIIMHGPLRLISLLPLSEPRRQQRRDSFRLRIGLSASVRPFTGSDFPPDPFSDNDEVAPWEEIFTNNLSESGISLNSTIPYHIGDCLHIKLTLDHAPDHQEQIELLGIIRQADTIDYTGKQYRLGIEFLPYSDNLRQLIARFVLKKQQLLRSELDQESRNWTS